MFNQSKPSLNVHALIRDMLEDERELLILLGQDFLTAHLEDVETRLHRWQNYFENHYARDTPPRGDADKLRVYQIEYALITQLATESQTEPFPVVHQRALQQARQRMRLLVNKRDFTNASLKSTRFEAHLEQEFLVDLWSKWHTWLKPRRLQNR
ncbi:hypothetical protein [Aggregatilinea lenta]|uniref:hypothetical protein n=1 Tax=Aggregatilinea lenta TaxID=913108 RepID=UPI000E5A8E72|nr:hypothetical protein [Aggregatilinea lenta]